MPTYDFECPDGHTYEVFCSIADREKAHPCSHVSDEVVPGATALSIEPNGDVAIEPVVAPGAACGKVGRQVILTAPHVNDPGKCVLDYPGSKRLKAGYVHTHGDRPASKTSAGYGGMVQGNVKRHAHPIAGNVQPEAVAPKKKVTW